MRVQGQRPYRPDTENMRTLLRAATFIPPERYAGDLPAIRNVLMTAQERKTPSKEFWYSSRLQTTGVSPAGREFVRGLLIANPTYRLGVNGASELKQHPWFDGLDWASLRDQELPAPFLPEINASNFIASEAELAAAAAAALEDITASLQSQSRAKLAAAGAGPGHASDAGPASDEDLPLTHAEQAKFVDYNANMHAQSVDEGSGGLSTAGGGSSSSSSPRPPRSLIGLLRGRTKSSSAAPPPPAHDNVSNARLGRVRRRSLGGRASSSRFFGASRTTAAASEAAGRTISFTHTADTIASGFYGSVGSQRYGAQQQQHNTPPLDAATGSYSGGHGSSTPQDGNITDHSAAVEAAAAVAGRSRNYSILGPIIGLGGGVDATAAAAAAGAATASAATAAGFISAVTPLINPALEQAHQKLVSAAVSSRRPSRGSRHSQTIATLASTLNGLVGKAAAADAADGTAASALVSSDSSANAASAAAAAQQQGAGSSIGTYLAAMSVLSSARTGPGGSLFYIDGLGPEAALAAREVEQLVLQERRRAEAQAAALEKVATETAAAAAETAASAAAIADAEAGQASSSGHGLRIRISQFPSPTSSSGSTSSSSQRPGGGGLPPPISTSAGVGGYAAGAGAGAAGSGAGSVSPHDAAPVRADSVLHPSPPRHNGVGEGAGAVGAAGFPSPSGDESPSHAHFMNHLRESMGGNSSTKPPLAGNSNNTTTERRGAGGSKRALFMHRGSMSPERVAAAPVSRNGTEEEGTAALAHVKAALAPPLDGGADNVGSHAHHTGSPHTPWALPPNDAGSSAAAPYAGPSFPLGVTAHTLSNRRLDIGARGTMSSEKSSDSSSIGGSLLYQPRIVVVLHTPSTTGTGAPQPKSILRNRERRNSSGGEAPGSTSATTTASEGRNSRNAGILSGGSQESHLSEVGVLSGFSQQESRVSSASRTRSSVCGEEAPHGQHQQQRSMRKSSLRRLSIEAHDCISPPHPQDSASLPQVEAVCA